MELMPLTDEDFESLLLLDGWMQSFPDSELIPLKHEEFVAHFEPILQTDWLHLRLFPPKD